MVCQQAMLSQELRGLGYDLPAGRVMTYIFVRFLSCHIDLADPLSYLGGIWGLDPCLLS